MANPMYGAINGVDDPTQPGRKQVQGDPRFSAINGVSDPSRGVFRRPSAAAPAVADPQAFAGGQTDFVGAPVPASPLATLPAVRGAQVAAQPIAPDESAGEAVGRYVRGARHIATLPGQVVGAGVDAANAGVSGFLHDVNVGISGTRAAPADITAAAATTPSTVAPGGAVTPTPIPGAPETSIPNYFAGGDAAPAAPPMSGFARSGAGRDLGTGAQVNGVPTFSDGTGGPGAVPRTMSDESLAALNKATAAPTGANDPNSTYNRAVADNAAHVASLTAPGPSALDSARANAADTTKNINSQIARLSNPMDPLGMQAANLRANLERATTRSGREAASAQLQSFMTSVVGAGTAGEAAKSGVEGENLKTAGTLANTGLGQQGEFARTALQQAGETGRLIQTQNAPTPEVDSEGNYRVRTGSTVTPVTENGAQATAPFINRNSANVDRAMDGFYRNNPGATAEEAGQHMSALIRAAATGTQAGAKAPPQAPTDHAGLAKDVPALLKDPKNSALIQQFEAKYGPGSAKAYTG